MIRLVNLIVGLLAVLFILLPTSPAAAGIPPESCCVCECGVRATTSQIQPIPEFTTCVELQDAVSSSECIAACVTAGCAADNFTFVDDACRNVAACAPASASSTMAPVASVVGLAAISLALSALGIHTLLRRKR